MRKQTTSDKPVYNALAEHQVSEDWELRELLVELQCWAERFDFEFKLEVPELSLCVDWLSRRCLGRFRYGFNGFGLRGEVAINRCYLQQREFWQVLGTLLHEMLHAWQQAYGTPGKGNYHNVEFRSKAHGLGLIVATNGVTDYAPDSPFVCVLKQHDVQVPQLPDLSPARPREGNSKLKKWSCGCTNVRVAVASFQAKCLRCGRLFVRAS